MFFSKTMELGNGQLTLESGKMAKQANGSAVIKFGDNVVLVTVCGKREPATGMDYFPLQVEYKEKFYASGKFPGGFIKREGRPSNGEILSARSIDRPIRPLFPEGFKNEVQVICSILSSDGEIKMDTFSVIGASLAINLSDIPFSEPVAAVRVGRKDGEFMINPTIKEMEECDIELVISGGKGFISMIEGESKEVSEQEILDAIEFGQKSIDAICDFQVALIEEFGKEKFTFDVHQIDKDLEKEVRGLSEEEIKKIISTDGKEDRNDAKKVLYADVHEKIATKYNEDEYAEKKSDINTILHDFEKDLMRKRIISENTRIDGRKTDEIRKITCEIEVLPRAHGSALFTRGETQSLGVCTLGAGMDTQRVDNIYESKEEKFYLHYNFPPFCVGEVKRIMGVSRREIGHGHLAERSFYPVLPAADAFPYTVRVVSEILESNGSSSMATVCSGSMALMSAGVPLKSGVSGIAMGLIKEGDDVAVLSDILGEEDHLGDMDFKVTGTSQGICAYQMDIKIHGITIDILKKALTQAKAGRAHILSIMTETISQTREGLSKHAPRILTIQLDPATEIATLIGPGGKNIKEIISTFGVKVDVNDTGLVKILSEDENGEKAKAHIEEMFKKPEIGAIYSATVKSIKPFGAFVEILPKQEGLLHVSEIALERVTNVEDFLKVGQKIDVKYVGKDSAGRIKLTRKELLKKSE